MNIFVIVIEFYVNLKNNFQNWIKTNIFYFTCNNFNYRLECLLKPAC